MDMYVREMCFSSKCYPYFFIMVFVINSGRGTASSDCVCLTLLNIMSLEMDVLGADMTAVVTIWL